MFTAEQIKTAQSKVRSGADFPSYIREIKSLGVTHYETCVSDGRIDYHGKNNYAVKVPARRDILEVAHTTDKEKFKAELLAHQQGKTDFLSFIKMCAETGVGKWKVCMNEMTCTYYDHAGNEILLEKIPQ